MRDQCCDSLMETSHLNVMPPVSCLSRRHETQPLLSRNAFAALIIAVSASAASAWAVPGVLDAATALVRGLLDNKVMWVCLGIALWHLLREPSPAVGGCQLMAALPALSLAATAGGIWPWVGLSLSLILMLVAVPGWGAARTGLLIALVAALHEIAIDLLGELTGDAVLGAEARVVGSLASWLMPALEVEGNALQRTDEHMVVLVWGCSSLSNLGDTLLLFWAIVSLRISGLSTQHPHRARFFACVVLLTGFVITLNALRLMFMARDPGTFAYLHGTEGSALFRLGTLGLTAMASVWSSPR